MVGYPGLRTHILDGHNFWAAYDKIKYSWFSFFDEYAVLTNSMWDVLEI